MSRDIKTLRQREKDRDRLRELRLTLPAEVLNNHAAELIRHGHFLAALTAMLRAVAQCPESGFLWAGLGRVYWLLGQWQSAAHALDRAQQLRPQYAAIYGNRAQLLASMGCWDLSRDEFAKAKKLEPNELAHPWNESMMLLAAGEWQEGFELYESRIKHRAEYYPTFPVPTWNGENLAGKTIFVQAEQGVGDRILASRYLFWLKNEYPTCRILFLDSSRDLPSVRNLFWGFRHIVEFMEEGVPFPENVDYAVMLMSLPRLSGTRVHNVPPDPGLILGRVSQEASLLNGMPTPYSPALKVGICWTGNPVMARNAERSIPLELLLRLEENPDVQLYNLQFGEGYKDLQRLGATELLHDMVPGIGNRGLVGTGAVMTKLDLVITSCTVTAHLAGALGVPCWVLLCEDPYWVWLRDRSDSVWYPSVRLFRQKRMGDWQPVVDEVKQALAQRAHEFLNAA